MNLPNPFRITWVRIRLRGADDVETHGLGVQQELSYKVDGEKLGQKVGKK